MLFLLWVSLEKSAVILMDLLLYVICFFLSYSLQYFFSVPYAYCFDDNMPWVGSVLVKSVWCPGGFLYLNGQNFLEICKFSVIILLNIL
jgi:hypothetical protein